MDLSPAFSLSISSSTTIRSGYRARNGSKAPRGTNTTSRPCVREFLADLRAYISLDADPYVEDRITAGLSRERAEPRYGLPFVGDNAFLLDRLEICDGPVKAHWYRRLRPDDETGIVAHTTRLTIWIDRQDMSMTRSALYAPLLEATDGDPGKCLDRDSATQRATLSGRREGGVSRC